MKTIILRGVPASLRQDGWWLDPITRRREPKVRFAGSPSNRHYTLHALALAVLIAAAQWLLVAAPAADNVALERAACDTGQNSDFHVVRALRSFGADPKPGTPL